MKAKTNIAMIIPIISTILDTVILLGKFISAFLVSIRPCKPCFVKDKNLSIHYVYALKDSVLLSYLPYQIWVSRLWGLPVPLQYFYCNRHCGTFRNIIMTEVLD